MSVITWTPTAASSEARIFDKKVWRVVEDQHRSSTVKLVDNLVEHDILESILESGKPPLPRGTENLDYLLASPFRYPPVFHGSRFREIGDPGVFSAAFEFRTAATELGFWRWKFLLSSSGLSRLDPATHTAFKAHIKGRSVDLTAAPFNRDSVIWKHPTSYAGTQEFGRVARGGGIEVIVYQSVRDPDERKCIAVLTPSAFISLKPDHDMQTWHLSVTREEIIWTHKFKESFSVETSLWTI
jgi:RES domain-containing protein